MLLGILIGTAGTITGTLGKQLLRYAEIQKQQGNTSVSPNNRTDKDVRPGRL
jgi:hypothetical protein